jgi:hypothetical protein
MNITSAKSYEDSYLIKRHAHADNLYDRDHLKKKLVVGCLDIYHESQRIAFLIFALADGDRAARELLHQIK